MQWMLAMNFLHLPVVIFICRKALCDNITVRLVDYDLMLSRGDIARDYGLEPCSRLLLQNDMFTSTGLQLIDSKNYSESCRFAANSLATCFDLETNTSCRETEWYCIVTPKRMCDGVSLCLHDECYCPNSKVTLFYCADGQGCVTLELVCDGYFDCLDHSDERICDGLIETKCRYIFDGDSIYKVEMKLPLSVLCDASSSHQRHYDCEYATGLCDSVQTRRKSLGRQNIEQCIQDLLSTHDMSDVQVVLNLSFSKSCTETCKNVSSGFCGHLVDQRQNTLMELFTFQCSDPGNDDDYFQQIAEYVVCNGKFDCRNGADEKFCNDRFYCSEKDDSTVSWISEKAVCNNYKDCKNGKDECANCTNSFISSDHYIIRSKLVFGGLIIGCALILFLKGYVFVVNYRKVATDRFVKVDRLLLLQICLYDMLIGCYLLSLIVATVVYYGRYCLHDLVWRSGWQCQCLGALFNFSSHGSLLVVLLMSLTRSYKCYVSFSHCIALNKVYIMSVALGLLNLAHSAVPIIPLEKIQDTFRSQIQFPVKNPFIMDNFDNVSHIYRIYGEYFGKDVIPENGLYSMLESLKNITSDSKMFAYTELSYYSWSPVCVQDQFGIQQSLLFYKIGYMLCITGILLMVTVSY